MTVSRVHERGAVSLFLVIFAALFITAITITFVRIMIQNQAQATLNDLSKSALDSAQAGIEDAKRAIITYKNKCTGDSADVSSEECERLSKALNNGKICDTMQQAGISGSVGENEVKIKRTTSDESLQQAYTCVKVVMNTDDFIGTVVPSVSHMVPLKSTETFTDVVVEWFAQSDLQRDLTKDASSPAPKVDLAVDSSLPKLADWPQNRPALLKVQLLQYGDSFNLSDFDNTVDDKANNLTLYLVPSLAGSNELSFMSDVRASHTSAALQQVRCDKNFSATSTDTQYACRAKISLPNPIGADSPDTRHAYLKVTGLYNENTTFRISMAKDDSTVVKFNGVQPAIDSTGRANNLFRRILSRVELEDSNIPNAEASVDISGSLCKTFLVTDQESDYNPGSCKI